VRLNGGSSQRWGEKTPLALNSLKCLISLAASGRLSELKGMGGCYPFSQRQYSRRCQPVQTNMRSSHANQQGVALDRR